MAARAATRRHDVQRMDDKNIVVHFGDYAATDPVLGMAEDFMRVGAHGFPEHPHRGFSTVSLVLQGQQRHRDSTGHSGLLEAGSVLWMTAGRGVIHSEFPDGPALCRSLQIWLNLPAAHKMDPPAYQQFAREQLPVVRDAAAEVAVIAGRHAGVAGPIRSVVPATCLVARVRAGACTHLELAADHNAFLYVIDGDGAFGRDRTKAAAGQVLWFDPVTANAAALSPEPTTVLVEAEHDLHVLLFGGAPLREPVFHQGPFVLHTRAALQQAFRDFADGTFLSA